MVSHFILDMTIKLTILTFIITILLITSINSYIPNANEDHFTLIVVYDNNEYNPKLKTDWGLSIYLEINDTEMLFDTGANPEILMYNLNMLNLSIDDLDVVVLSHIHGDHVNGLSAIINRNKNVIVYIPSSFPISFKEKLRSLGIKFVEVSSWIKIKDYLYLTGELSSDGVHEQALVIKTKYGAIILSGCAHPGIDNFLIYVVNNMGIKNILLVGGGFHLIGASEDRIKAIINTFEKYKVKAVMPIHCSGDLARKLFKTYFNGSTILAGVGYTLTENDLKVYQSSYIPSSQTYTINREEEEFPPAHITMLITLILIIAIITYIITMLKRKTIIK